MANLNNKKEIVIVGGGLAGLAAIKVLLKADWSVHLITLDSYFTFLPLLHELAAGSLPVDSLRFAYRGFLKSDNFKLTVAQVEQIDLAHHCLLAGQTKISFDYLLIATGSHTAQDKVIGSQYALTLNTWQQAEVLAQRLVALPQSGAIINIIGAGFTGLELSLEIADQLKQKKLTAVINLLHSQVRLAPWLPESGHQIIAQALKRQGINFLALERVVAIGPQYILTKTGQYRGDLNILTTGIAPNTAMLSTDVINDRGEVLVNSYLQVEGQTRMWAAGDIISLGNRTVPKLAQTAVQQGRVVANNIIRQQSGRALRPYQPKIKGLFLALDQMRAIGHINHKLLYGHWVWFVWRTIYFFNIPGLRNRRHLARIWTRRFLSRH
ncbi:MAG: FAD-dependent oxidoreductase [bacterium]